ncbi:MAG: eukaryotic-like serine/threonine-protein kinase [Myxococcales bacterium]|nr:eukaryotic-like serine/threonine-protein kinase [Myxococcales bacterium]
MASPQIKAGDVLDRKYRVERVLGTGGMGMVVAARHVQLGQRVALKFMLKEALADPGNAERFAREARAAVRLQSPHTAKVLDVGKLKNGEPYMVMDYLDGQDLDEVLQRNGAMTPHMAVEYILQACEAFAEAHSLGMIHRDIKLKNLFLVKTVDGRPLVKVLDFGLAKTIGALGDVSLTATSAVFGSPQYMSPEQMRSAKDVDTRSDIWSIGVCLYELLTARLPFDAAGLAEICAMVLKDPVPPPSKWAIGLPPDLDAVVVKCLEKDPKNRYQTVAELAFALEPWTAIEGSANRILHVMQTVQKTDIPTLVNADPTSLGHDGPKTMDAWDSGERTRPTTKNVPPIAWVLGGFLTLAILGIVFGGAAVLANKAGRKTVTTATAAAGDQGAASAPLTPVPVPLPVPDVAPSETAVATMAPPQVVAPATPAPAPTDAQPAPPEPPPLATAATTTTPATVALPAPPIVKPPVPPSAHPPKPPATAPTTKPAPSAKPGGKPVPSPFDHL